MSYSLKCEWLPKDRPTCENETQYQIGFTDSEGSYLEVAVCPLHFNHVVDMYEGRVDILAHRRNFRKA